MDPASVELFMTYPWRTGRRNHRVLYAVLGDEPSDDDVMIGSVDYPEVANLIVMCHNLWRTDPR